MVDSARRFVKHGVALSSFHSIELTINTDRNAFFKQNQILTEQTHNKIPFGPNDLESTLSIKPGGGPGLPAARRSRIPHQFQSFPGPS